MAGIFSFLNKLFDICCVTWKMPLNDNFKRENGYNYHNIKR